MSGHLRDVGIAQIEAGNPLLFEFVGADADSRHAVAGSRLIGMQEAIFGRPLPPFGRVCNHSLWAIGAPFSATERLINNTRNATANVNTATIQKQSK